MLFVFFLTYLSLFRFVSLPSCLSHSLLLRLCASVCETFSVFNPFLSDQQKSFSYSSYYFLLPPLSSFPPPFPLRTHLPSHFPFLPPFLHRQRRQFLSLSNHFHVPFFIPFRHKAPVIAGNHPCFVQLPIRCPLRISRSPHELPILRPFHFSCIRGVEFLGGQIGGKLLDDFAAQC